VVLLQSDREFFASVRNCATLISNGIRIEIATEIFVLEVMMMEPIKAGAAAPDFVLHSAQGEAVKLSDYRGKKVVLSWHPLAWTAVCTDQMRSLEVHHDQFAAQNAVAFGLSVDSAPSKKAWVAVLSIQNTVILSDFWPQGKVARDYGIFREEFGTSQRANIIIDEVGVVRWVKVYPIAELPDIDEVLNVLAEM